MAITRRWQTGCESGNIWEFNGGYVGSVGIAGTAYTGSYGLTIYNASQPDNVQVNVPSTYQFRLGWWAYHQHRPQDPYRSVVGARDSGGTQRATLYMNGTNYGGQMRLTANISAYTGTNAYWPVKWRHWAMDVKINSSTGWIYLYRDGELVASASGNTGSTPIQSLYFGSYEARLETENYFDDLYFDDTTGEGSAAKVPILRFYPLSPNGNGNYAQWDGSDGNSVDNYLLLDERPPSDSDYVQTNVTDEYDSYAMSTRTIQTGEVIRAVIPWARANRGGTTEQIALGTRYSSTDSIGSDQNPDASPEYLYERQTTKPTGGDWDQTSLDGFETVVKSRGSY